MKEPHRKGVANRSNSESCAGGGNIAGEALTGAYVQQRCGTNAASLIVTTQGSRRNRLAICSV